MSFASKICVARVPGMKTLSFAQMSPDESERFADEPTGESDMDEPIKAPVNWRAQVNA
jgi:hypothetical protein